MGSLVTGVEGRYAVRVIYWAHSDPDGLAPESPGSRWQLLSAHLEAVEVLASELAANARPSDAAFAEAAGVAGILHDFGKYTDCFQKMIREGTGRCQHSAHGAAIASAAGRFDAAFAIAGHHSGIPDVKGGTGTLKVRIEGVAREANGLKSRAMLDLTAIQSAFDAPAASTLRKEQFDLRTRMLFSCLVDADRLDSAGRGPEFGALRAGERLEQLLGHIHRLATGDETAVNRARRLVLEECLEAAAFPERLLSLNVPTGGGKTLAAMAFALKRAEMFPRLYRRVIVVIPYLSIIEQNAEVYAKIFGRDEVFEHHSGSFDRLTAIDREGEHYGPIEDSGEEETYRSLRLRNMAENWDAPLIVTTSVRFFESLFSNRPSDLRRVHNIARSIIVLDEVQTLPRRLLAPLLTVIKELAEDWGCTFVFSTATLPAFEKPAGSLARDARWAPATIRPVINDSAALHGQLKRVTISWELEETVSWPDLAKRLLDEKSVLCVVNLRDHASVLYDEVIAQRGDECETFHLSTRMCAAHRLRVIEKIKQRLKDGLPCRVVSTQLIEAGVDLDFPVVFRALGPMDSVFQAAGRADREGLLTAKAGAPAGRVIVFRPEDDRMPPNEYAEAAGLTRALVGAAGGRVQAESLDWMEKYWERYYGEGGDQGANLQEHRERYMFATLAREFEMISDRTLDVFVPFDEDARSAINELRAIGQLTRDLRRRLQRYVVGLRPYEFEKARRVLEEVRKDSGIWVAVEQAYTLTKGMKYELGISDTIL